ncbi:hypothetical protein KTR9_4981 (plasmid) [Gordonia sp. KTR9]|nr:hypothetical protein KTR9_4981 [Gordonia sp. KTR9]
MSGVRGRLSVRRRGPRRGPHDGPRQPVEHRLAHGRTHRGLHLRSRGERAQAVAGVPCGRSWSAPHSPARRHRSLMTAEVEPGPPWWRPRPAARLGDPASGGDVAFESAELGGEGGGVGEDGPGLGEYLLPAGPVGVVAGDGGGQVGVAALGDHRGELAGCPGPAGCGSAGGDEVQAGVVDGVGGLGVGGDEVGGGPEQIGDAADGGGGVDGVSDVVHEKVLSLWSGPVWVDVERPVLTGRGWAVNPEEAGAPEATFGCERSERGLPKWLERTGGAQRRTGGSRLVWVDSSGPRSVTLGRRARAIGDHPPDWESPRGRGRSAAEPPGRDNAVRPSGRSAMPPRGWRVCVLSGPRP